MPQLPFEIVRDNGIVTGSNGWVTLSCDQVSSQMRRRRLAKPGKGLSEMVYVELADKTRVYVHQRDNGTVAVMVTRQEIYL